MERSDVDKVDDVMLPGFRFHPTDEELVGFYLIRKIQHQSLPIELIKPVDIYKYDPWDLPKLASSGEKEWYFYCPRDRKYRNSARPNRVTATGFWKATGTDRPIYSSDGKCIGLKKSLVFYRGRAAKGVKTDWMMHEFRLPSVSDSTPSKKILNKSFSAPQDAWAICRIFKKTSSMAQRALSHSWMTALPEVTVSDMMPQGANCQQFSSENISCTTEIGSVLHFCGNTDIQQTSSTSFSDSDVPPYKPMMNPTTSKPSRLPVSNGNVCNSVVFSGPNKSPGDGNSMLFNTTLMDFDESTQQFGGFPVSLQQDMPSNVNAEEGEDGTRKSTCQEQVSNQWGTVRPIGFPFSLSPSDVWKPPTWFSPTCPDEMSSGYSTNKSHT